MTHLRFVVSTCVLALASLLLMAGGGCAAPPADRSAADTLDANPFAILKTHGASLGDSRQALLVVAPPSSSAAPARFARLWMLERFDTRSAWVIVHGPFPAAVGSAGFAPPSDKREGDKRTPSGIYTITELFGSDAAFKPRLPYKIATLDDAWCEDPTSPNYNQWISGDEARKANDRLARSDDLYVHAAVIDYNRWPVVPGAGSAIFMHKAEPAGAGTLGCVGLEQGPLDTILLKLDPTKSPMIVMGTLDVLTSTTSGFPRPPTPPARP